VLFDRVEVSFQLHDYENGQPFIGLAFSRDGEPVKCAGKLFAIELSPGTSQLDAETIVQVLRRHVTHFSMVARKGPSASSMSSLEAQEPE
jgi:hypothetical protein